MAEPAHFSSDSFSSSDDAFSDEETEIDNGVVSDFLVDTNGYVSADDDEDEENEAGEASKAVDDKSTPKKQQRMITINLKVPPSNRKRISFVVDSPDVEEMYAGTVFGKDTVIEEHIKDESVLLKDVFVLRITSDDIPAEQRGIIHAIGCHDATPGEIEYSELFPSQIKALRNRTIKLLAIKHKRITAKSIPRLLKKITADPTLMPPNADILDDIPHSPHAIYAFTEAELAPRQPKKSAAQISPEEDDMDTEIPHVKAPTLSKSAATQKSPKHPKTPKAPKETPKVPKETPKVPKAPQKRKHADVEPGDDVRQPTARRALSVDEHELMVDGCSMIKQPPYSMTVEYHGSVDGIQHVHSAMESLVGSLTGKGTIVVKTMCEF